MSTENFHNTEAIEKLKELVNKIDIGMLCTYPSEQGYIHAIPMSRQEVDEEGNIWYLFSSESETYANLERNHKVSVLFSHVGDYTFLSVNGVAEISRDKQRVEKYWNKFVEAWFEKGKEDPRIRVLKVKVEDAHYWDNKTNKLVTFFKLAASAVSGQKLDIGREGELNI
ncbi:pyridoxamine 5'-phosphate oxidase family protein [Agriterribacter sp.]|uniref:pyridoxamine 5'-phosphate oxidase family protein n=1 Tax=Agriterribacter sp. TaxID=2821509 RepID=UPI002CC64A0C|nr:pyridoxamine 5'-phosphate oxidase family protein [Agriterribacter sp.]HRO45148.1 pyridoxamine 5'-phosphate oxidase family protein [Agriterribacter sp.]HRQ17753.1 pyridoxamine 5'-phosphate oxidase family protein [Agriterribacter sp.]